MIINENNTYDENSDSVRNEQEKTNPQSLEQQEQENSANLTERVEEEHEVNATYGDSNEMTNEPSQGEEDLSGFLERTLPEEGNSFDPERDKPVTKNLLGDNPPGSEQAAFDNGNFGDATADQFTYDSGNLRDALQENVDKTEQQINLDKKLKENSGDL